MGRVCWLAGGACPPAACLGRYGLPASEGKVEAQVGGGHGHEVCCQGGAGAQQAGCQQGVAKVVLVVAQQAAQVLAAACRQAGAGMRGYGGKGRVSRDRRGFGLASAQRQRFQVHVGAGEGGSKGWLAGWLLTGAVKLLGLARHGAAAAAGLLLQLLLLDEGGQQGHGHGGGGGRSGGGGASKDSNNTTSSGSLGNSSGKGGSSRRSNGGALSSKRSRGSSPSANAAAAAGATAAGALASNGTSVLLCGPLPPGSHGYSAAQQLQQQQLQQQQMQQLHHLQQLQQTQQAALGVDLLKQEAQLAFEQQLQAQQQAAQQLAAQQAAAQQQQQAAAAELNQAEAMLWSDGLCENDIAELLAMDPGEWRASFFPSFLLLAAWPDCAARLLGCLAAPYCLAAWLCGRCQHVPAAVPCRRHSHHHRPVHRSPHMPSPFHTSHYPPPADALADALLVPASAGLGPSSAPNRSMDNSTLSEASQWPPSSAAPAEAPMAVSGAGPHLMGPAWGLTPDASELPPAFPPIPALPVHPAADTYGMLGTPSAMGAASAAPASAGSGAAYGQLQLPAGGDWAVGPEAAQVAAMQRQAGGVAAALEHAYPTHIITRFSLKVRLPCLCQPHCPCLCPCWRPCLCRRLCLCRCHCLCQHASVGEPASAGRLDGRAGPSPAHGLPACLVWAVISDNSSCCLVACLFACRFLA